jgi:hypothetical protein
MGLLLVVGQEILQILLPLKATMAAQGIILPLVLVVVGAAVLVVWVEMGQVQPVELGALYKHPLFLVHQ